MAQSSNNEQKIKSMMNKTRELLKEIRTKLNESKSEALLNFQLEKKKFHDTLIEAQERIDELKKEGKVDAQQLQAALDDLKVQLALGKADTLQELERQKNQIDTSYRKFKDKAKTSFHESSKHLKVAWNRYASRLMEEEEKMETNYKLHKMQFEEEADKNVKKKKQDLNKQIENLQEYLKEDRDRTTTKIENLSAQLNQKLEELKHKLAS